MRAGLRGRGAKVVRVATKNQSVEWSSSSEEEEGEEAEEEEEEEGASRRRTRGRAVAGNRRTTARAPAASSVSATRRSTRSTRSRSRAQEEEEEEEEHGDEEYVSRHTTLINRLPLIAHLSLTLVRVASFSSISRLLRSCLRVLILKVMRLRTLTR